MAEYLKGSKIGHSSALLNVASPKSRPRFSLASPGQMLDGLGLLARALEELPLREDIEERRDVGVNGPVGSGFFTFLGLPIAFRFPKTQVRPWDWQG